MTNYHNVGVHVGAERTGRLSATSRQVEQYTRPPWCQEEGEIRMS